MRRALGVLALCAASIGLSAPSSAAQDLRFWQHAGLAQSERLRLHAYGQALAARGGQDLATAVQREMYRQGYYHSGGRPNLVEKTLQIAPVLAWDGNINAGVMRDRFAVNNLVFEADPDYRAKAGLVAGVTAGGSLRFAWSEGRSIQLQMGSEWAYAPRHDIGRGDLFLGLCAQNHLRGWTFLDLCANGTRSWRQLGNAEDHRVSLALAQIFALGPGLHDAGWSLQSVSSTDGPQARMAFSLESLWQSGWVSDLSLTLGARKAQSTVLRQRLDLTLRRNYRGQSLGLELWAQRADGSGFLGIARRDHAWGIGVSRSLSPNLSLRLAYGDYRSTAPIADYRQISLDVRLSQWRW